jgi:sarcosine oxidase gamma subunit
MAEIGDPLSPVNVNGVSVSLDPRMAVVSLRCFDSHGQFSRAVQSFLGVPLPGKLRATYASQLTGADKSIAAWRSPTETLFLCNSSDQIVQLHANVASLSDGCIVDQSGGLLVFRTSGPSITDLFARIGGQATLPVVGESRRSRLADIPVSAIRMHTMEILLVVERVYAEHMMSWIRVSAAEIS